MKTSKVSRLGGGLLLPFFVCLYSTFLMFMLSGIGIDDIIHQGDLYKDDPYLLLYRGCHVSLFSAIKDGVPRDKQLHGVVEVEIPGGGGAAYWFSNSTPGVSGGRFEVWKDEHFFCYDTLTFRFFDELPEGASTIDQIPNLEVKIHRPKWCLRPTPTSCS